MRGVANGLIRKPKQTERVVDYIKRFGSITALEAFIDLGVCQLATRIFELKKAGYQFKTHFKTVENRFGEKCTVKVYEIEKEPQKQGEKADV